MKDLFDFQVRSDEVRFRNQEDYALALLSGLRPSYKRLRVDKCLIIMHMY